MYWWIWGRWQVYFKGCLQNGDKMYALMEFNQRKKPWILQNMWTNLIAKHQAIRYVVQWISCFHISTNTSFPVMFNIQGACIPSPSPGFTAFPTITLHVTYLSSQKIKHLKNFHFCWVAKLEVWLSFVDLHRIFLCKFAWFHFCN